MAHFHLVDLLFSEVPLIEKCVRHPMQIRASAINDLQRSKSSLEALFCYDKAVPEENIGKPAGLDLEKKEVGKNPPCVRCETKGAVLCATCAGSGLYVDSIMESQGIIVKVVEELEASCAPRAEAVGTPELFVDVSHKQGNEIQVASSWCTSIIGQDSSSNLYAFY
uniref:Uncharacterized protein n=1 Tax=Aegilops tauschii TaxID=37682 RepID=M8CAE3_AEGTA